MLTVYLGGPINGRTDAECKDWRAMVTEALAGRMNVRDPMVRDYRGKEDESVEAIVEQDKNDMRASGHPPVQLPSAARRSGRPWRCLGTTGGFGRCRSWSCRHDNGCRRGCAITPVAWSTRSAARCQDAGRLLRGRSITTAVRDLRWLDGSARVLAPTPSRPEKE
jgi:hypothetical protein